MLLHVGLSQVYAAIQENAVYHGNTRRYCISTLIKFKLPSKKMQFIMKYTTLLPMDPSQV